MKTAEELKKYRAMSRDDLAKELGVLQKRAELELLKVRAGKGTNSALSNSLRKSVARALTVVSENQSGEHRNE
ncbi:MAG: 50S ribosomal protein L29 [Patescibacteria group bacterium]